MFERVRHFSLYPTKLLECTTSLSKISPINITTKLRNGLNAFDEKPILYYSLLFIPTLAITSILAPEATLAIGTGMLISFCCTGVANYIVRENFFQKLFPSLSPSQAELASNIAASIISNAASFIVYSSIFGGVAAGISTFLKMKDLAILSSPIIYFAAEITTIAITTQFLRFERAIELTYFGEKQLAKNLGIDSLKDYHNYDETMSHTFRPYVATMASSTLKLLGLRSSAADLLAYHLSKITVKFSFEENPGTLKDSVIAETENLLKYIFISSKLEKVFSKIFPERGLADIVKYSVNYTLTDEITKLFKNMQTGVEKYFTPIIRDPNHVLNNILGQQIIKDSQTLAMTKN